MSGNDCFDRDYFAMNDSMESTAKDVSVLHDEKLNVCSFMI